MNSILRFGKKNASLFYCLSFILFGMNFGWSQTQPAAQGLPYSQNFASLTGSAPSYPVGWQGWAVNATAVPSSGGRTNAPVGDKTIAVGTAASTGNGVYDYNGKIGFLSSSSADNAIALAVNTTGFSGVVVTFDAMTIRNTYDGTTNITQGLVLQYRTDTSSAFTNIAYTTSAGGATEYQNNTTTQITGTTGQNIVTGLKATLPAACNNQAVVQLRWIYRNVGPGTVGTSGRPTMAIDNVSVAQPASLSTSVSSLSSFNYLFGSGPSTPQSFTVSGSGLSANAVVTAPTNNYEVCLTSGGTYANTVSITPSSGTISAVSVFVRLKAGIAVNSYSESLTVVSGSTSATSVACSGSVSPLTPNLVTGSLAAFTNRCINTTSSSNTFTISGTNLTTDPITVGPLSGFAFSLNGTTFSSSLSLTQSGGTYGPTTISVQFTPTAVGSYNGNISVGGGGTASAVSVAASGSGINTAATTANGSASAITSASATVAGTSTAGCSSVTVVGIEYSTTTGFTNGTGTQVSGTGSASFSASLTGLSASTTYYYKSYVTDGTGTIYAASQSSFTTSAIDAPVATAATSVTSSGFVANWGTVSAASSYLFDVLKSEKVVEWTFPTLGTTLTADATSNANNTASALTLSSGTVSDVTGLTTRAASGTAWTTLGKYWEISLNTTSYYNLTISSVQNSSASGPRDFKLQYKIGAGGTYTDVPSGAITVANDYISGLVSNLALPAVCDNQASVYIRWITTSTTNTGGTAITSGGTNRIDNIVVKGITPIAGYNNLSVATNSTSVSGLSPLTDYFYRARATNASSTSVNSNLIAVTTRADETVADYRSKATGNFSDSSTWEYFDNVAWSSASVPPTSANNITIVSPHEVTLTADITVGTNKTLTVNGVWNAAGKVVSGAGTFALASGATIKLGDNVSLATAVTATTKTFDVGANYIYNGTVAQTTASLPGAITGNLTIANAAGVTFTSNKAVNTPGTFAVTNNGNVIFGNGANTVYYVSGTGAFSANSGSTFVLTNSNGIANDGLTGNIRLTGTRAFASGINYSFTKNDVTTFLPSNMGTSFGVEITSINNLIVNNPNNVIVPTNITVDGTLTFTAGNIVTGVNTITIGENGSVSRSSTGASSGYVVGNLKKNIATTTAAVSYEIGDASSYRPIDLAFTGVTVAGTLSANVSQTAGAHPQIASSSIIPTKLVNRYFTLNGTSLAFASYNATFNYVASDVLNSASTSSFIVGQYNGASWNYPTVGTLSSTSSQATGLTSFGDFAFGEAKPLMTSAILSGDSTICSGSSTSLNVVVTGGTSPYTVVYNNGASDISVTGYTSGAAISVSPALNTVYTLVSVTDTYGYTSPSNSGSATVTVNPLTTNGDVTTSICAGDSYTWPANGQSYTIAQSGTTFVSGCNTATLNLTINPLTTTGDVTTAICAGGSYTWPANGQSYNTPQSGTTYVSGCNTATLNLTVNALTTNGDVTTSICAGGSYTWSANGQSYTTAQSGTTFVSGCNTATLNLTVNPLTTNGDVTTSICAGGSYTWPANGQAYTIAQSGTTYVSGCNTATLNLTVNSLTTTGDVTTAICAGGSYTWPANGQSYNTPQSGTTYVSGCNTATLNLTVDTPTTWYADTDADTYGDIAVSQLACAQPSGYVTDSSDCNDADNTKWQFATFYVDADADGYDLGTASICSGVGAPSGYSAITNGTDCDDNNATIYRSATLYIDADGDTFTVGAGTVTCYGANLPAGTTLTQSGSDDCDDTNAALNNNCVTGKVVNLTMFIEGYYVGGNTMNSVRVNQDYVSPSDEVEVVTVNLHDATTYELMDTATGTLKTDGTLSVTFTTAAAGSYYVAVKGVNMIETWTATPQTVGSSPLSYDFSSSASQAYGSNMKEIEPGVFACYQGDINQDGSIDNSDYDQLFPDIENSNFGVQATDLNGDGAVDNSDTDFIPFNVENSIFANYPF